MKLFQRQLAAILFRRIDNQYEEFLMILIVVAAIGLSEFYWGKIQKGIAEN